MELTYFSLFLLLSTTKTPVSFCVNKRKTLKYGEKQNGQGPRDLRGDSREFLGFSICLRHAEHRAEEVSNTEMGTERKLATKARGPGKDRLRQNL